MAKINLEEYYAEQEERMNIPDETGQDYLKRTALFKRGSVESISMTRRPNGNQSLNVNASTSRNPHTQMFSESPGMVSQDLSLLPATVCHASDDVNSKDRYENSGRTKKCKAISQDTDSDSSGTKQKRSMTDLNDGKAVTDLPESNLIPSIPHEVKDIQAEEKHFSPSIEDIDSFTVSDILDAPLLPKANLNQRDVPSEKRHLDSARGPDVSQIGLTTDLSPISSFSRSIDSFISKRPNSRQGDLAIIPRQPQLNLRPLDQVPLSRHVKNGAKSSKVRRLPCASLIEDVTLTMTVFPLPAPVKEALRPESSDMYLEVKERIAKHQPSRPRERVLLQGSKLILPESSNNAAAAEAIQESSIIYVSSSPSSRASSPNPVKRCIAKRTEKNKKQTKPAVEKKGLKGKGKKEKPPLMTPAEYARMLHEKITASDVQNGSTSLIGQRRKGPNFRFLEGKNIFYTGGDMKHASETTRKRMDIIVRHGGNLMPEYDSDVTTHVITEAQMLPTLRAMGLKRLREIPEHIPTVKWSWLLSVIGRENSLSLEEIEDKLNNVWLYAAFAERMDAGYRPKAVHPMSSFRIKAKIKDELKETGPRASILSPVPAEAQSSSSAQGEMNERIPSVAFISPSTSPLRPKVASRALSLELIDELIKVDDEPSKWDANDPLAEFYEQAVAQRYNEDGWSTLGKIDNLSKGEASGRDSFQPDGHVPLQKRGWSCDIREPDHKTQCPNQHIIDKLTELMELHKSKPGDEDHWRAFSYSKAIRALRSHPFRIKSFEEARRIRGVGDKTAQKIEEIIRTGNLRRISYEKTEDIDVTRLFQGIYGVGRSIAYQWYSAGCRTLEDLRAGKGGVKLTAAQEIGLRFYEDINSRMPREEAGQIFELIKTIALSIDPKLFIEIMGSYRRGKATCGDIDILITRPTDDGLTHHGVLSRLLAKLRSADILTEDLAVLEDPHNLEGTYRGLCHFPGVAGSKRRRIDFLTVPWKSRGAALLYYTGDDIFNRAIRLKANVMGYSLNQRGLFGNVIRDPRDRRLKINEGVLVASETEEEIFRILGVPWQEPSERARG